MLVEVLFFKRRIISFILFVAAGSIHTIVNLRPQLENQASVNFTCIKFNVTEFFTSFHL